MEGAVMTNPLKEFMDLLPEYEALKQLVEGSDQLTACFEHEKPFLDAAIAAIHYLQSGVAVVPREPTEAMITAAQRLPWWPDYENGRTEPPVLRHLYSAMITAASPSPAAKVEDERPMEKLK